MRSFVSALLLGSLGLTACQQFDALPNTSPEPGLTSSTAAPRYAVVSVDPEADALLQIQRVNNTFCDATRQSEGHLPNVTYVLTRTGELKFGTGSSISTETSTGELSTVRLSEAEFTVIKQTLEEVQTVLAEHTPPAFSVQSPVLNPPTYTVGDCAIFEAFDLLAEEGRFQRYDRPDFELYEAPRSVYAPEYIAALDRLKTELTALKRKYAQPS